MVNSPVWVHGSHCPVVFQLQIDHKYLALSVLFIKHSWPVVWTDFCGLSACCCAQLLCVQDCHGHVMLRRWHVLVPSLILCILTSSYFSISYLLTILQYSWIFKTMLKCFPLSFIFNILCSHEYLNFPPVKTRRDFLV